MTAGTSRSGRGSLAMTVEDDQENSRKGPLNPTGEDGLVVVQDPPAAALHLSPDEADISGLRLLDAAHRARLAPGERDD